VTGSPRPRQRYFLSSLGDDVEPPRLRLAVAHSFQCVRPFGKAQQEYRTLRCHIQHCASAAVRHANVDVGDELVGILCAVVPREREPQRKLGAQRASADAYAGTPPLKAPIPDA